MYAQTHIWGGFIRWNIVSASFTQMWSVGPHFDAHGPHCIAATSTVIYANIGFMRKNMQMNHFTLTPHVKYAGIDVLL